MSGRQTLRIIYKEFERDDATTVHIAYGHLERMTFSGKDEHLEAFVNSWDALMLTFKTKPTESHLYSALMSRLKKLPGLATTVAHMDRQVNGHPDRCFDFLMNAARRLVENRRNERQEHELNKLFAAGSNTSPALPAGQKGAGKGAGKGTKGKVDRKMMPCFKMRDTGNCPDGDKCEYSHKKDIIDAAQEKKKNGKGKGKSKKSGIGKGKVKLICRGFHTSGKGCLRRSSCHFLHEQPAMAAASVASALALAVAGQKLSNVTSTHSAYQKSDAASAPTGLRVSESSCADAGLRPEMREVVHSGHAPYHITEVRSYCGTVLDRSILSSAPVSADCPLASKNTDNGSCGTVLDHSVYSSAPTSSDGPLASHNTPTTHCRATSSIAYGRASTGAWLRRMALSSRRASSRFISTTSAWESVLCAQGLPTDAHHRATGGTVRLPVLLKFCKTRFAARDGRRYECKVKYFVQHFQTSTFS